jgi:hypothetical protein
MLRCVVFFIKKVVLWNQYMIKNDLKLGTFPTISVYLYKVLDFISKNRKT